MTRPSTPTDVLRSMVDHPAGRHRESVTIPPRDTSCHGPHAYRGPHGDDHRVGHIDPHRDAAPGGDLFDEVGLVLVVAALIAVLGILVALGNAVAGIPGAVLISVVYLAAVTITLRRL